MIGQRPQFLIHPSRNGFTLQIRSSLTLAIIFCIWVVGVFVQKVSKRKGRAHEGVTEVVIARPKYRKSWIVCSNLVERSCSWYHADLSIHCIVMSEVIMIPSD